VRLSAALTRVFLGLRRAFMLQVEVFHKTTPLDLNSNQLARLSVVTISCAWSTEKSRKYLTRTKCTWFRDSIKLLPFQVSFKLRPPLPTRVSSTLGTVAMQSYASENQLGLVNSA
jgi:hypothetical protein